MNTKDKRNDSPLNLSEETFPIIEQITTGMPGGFFIYHADEEGKLIYANRSLIKMYGCDDLDDFKSYTGFTFSGLVHPQDLERVCESIHSQITENDDLDYVEYRIVRKDGEIRWIEDYGHFVRTGHYGDIFYVFVEDATAKHYKQIDEENAKMLMEEKLRTMERLEHETTSLRIVHEILGSGMWTMEFDENGKMIGVLWSDTFRFMLGYKSKADFPDELESWSCLIHDEDRDGVLKEYYDTIYDYTGRKTFNAEYRLLTKDKGYRWFRSKGRLSRRNDGTPVTYVGTFVDITERVRITQEFREQRKLLEQALKQAQNSDRAKTVFLNNMSHDIRTPMNAIIGFAALAEAHIDDRELLKDYISKILASGNYLLSLINDVLDMSRIESGKLQIEEDKCLLSDIMNELCSIVEADISSKELDFSIDTSAVVNDKIICDRLRLNQVLLNIVSNSLKFTQKNGMICISVSERRGASEGYELYEFKIRDNGIGMSREFIDHIFEPFERERTSTVSGTQGTGLGMAITKNIVDLMKGTVTVESEEGMGTQFTVSFTFPIWEENDEDPEHASSVDDKGCDEDARSKWLADKEFFTKKRLLLVEDNELNREIAQTILEEAGFCVDTAEDGSKAVEMVKKSDKENIYDIILMDLQMPVMDGFEATREIRRLKDPVLSGIPIIALTANAFDEDRRLAFECGMNGHLGKPIEIDKLLSTLKEILESRQD